MKLQINYNIYEKLTFDLNDYAYIFCLNRDIGWQLLRTLKRYSRNKTLTLLEENVYGTNGLTILANGLKIDLKDISFLVLDQRDSILNEFSGKKGTLLFEQVESLKKSYYIQEQIDKLNDMLLQLEVSIEKIALSKFTSVKTSLGQLQLEDLLKKMLSFKYEDTDYYFPLEMMDVNKMIKDFCELLRQRIINNQKRVFLWLINPQNFLNSIACEYLLNSLKELSKTKLLNFIVISDKVFTDNYCYEDIERTKIVIEDVYELLPYNDLHEIIESHYPTDFNLTDRQLLEAIYRLIPLLASKKVSIANKDMILLKVLGKLLNTSTPDSVDTSELSYLEQRFLKDN